MLETIGLADRAKDLPKKFSGGMKRRLTIARGLINEPDMMLLDEPTTGLDPQARHVIWQKLRQLQSQGVTLILTTHYMDEAHILCDEIAIMDTGKIIAQGSPDTLLEERYQGLIIDTATTGIQNK